MTKQYLVVDSDRLDIFCLLSVLNHYEHHWNAELRRVM